MLATEISTPSRLGNFMGGLGPDGLFADAVKMAHRLCPTTSRLKVMAILGVAYLDAVSTRHVVYANRDTGLCSPWVDRSGS